jgi:hypothetical protein
MPAHLPDDVTVMVLRRLAQVADSQAHAGAEREPVHA